MRVAALVQSSDRPAPRGTVRAAQSRESRRSTSREEPGLNLGEGKTFSQSGRCIPKGSRRQHGPHRQLKPLRLCARRAHPPVARPRQQEWLRHHQQQSKLPCIGTLGPLANRARHHGTLQGLFASASGLFRSHERIVFKLGFDAYRTSVLIRSLAGTLDVLLTLAETLPLC